MGNIKVACTMTLLQYTKNTINRSGIKYFKQKNKIDFIKNWYCVNIHIFFCGIVFPDF